MLDRVQQLFAELRRRHVWRVALAYAAVAVATVQGLDILVPIFGGPDWIMQVALVVAVLGFPLAVALGWVYELTPQGIRRDQRTTAEPTGVAARLAFLALVAVSVVSMGWWSVRSVVDRNAPGSPASAPAEIGVAASTVSASSIRSLAVLPLDDFSPQGGNEYFAAGMHEALIASLSEVPSLRVISRTSVSRYDSTSLSLPDIGRELGADGVIEGSVVREGNRVRITIQLIHAPSDSHVWSNTYDGDMSDVLGLQARVARAIASEIEAELSPGELVEVTSARVASADAQESYMRGRAEAEKGTPEAMRAAREHFSEAIEYDPEFAPALAALAGTDAILQMTAGQDGGLPDMARLEEAQAMAYKAMELDSGSTEAIAAAAMIHRQMAEMAQEIRAEAGIEIRIDQEGLPDAEWVASFSDLGRNWQMLSMKRSEPGPGTARAVTAQVNGARRLVMAGEAEGAVRLLQNVVEENPDRIDAWLLLEEAQTADGDYDEAVGTIVHLSRQPNADISPAEAEALEEAVHQDGARAYWAWKTDLLSRRQDAGLPVQPSQMAMAYAAQGENDRAFEFLDDALQQGDPGLYTLRSHPAWDPIRSDPRFAHLVRKVRAAPRPRRPGRSR